MDHHYKNIIQRNINNIPKAFGGGIEVIQSNSSTIEQNTGGEIRIVQTNTSTIRNPVKREQGIRRESRKEPERPEASNRDMSIEEEQPGNTIIETVQVPVAVVSTAVIPDEVFIGLDTAAGKIKAQIANQFFKTRLLELVARAKQFLQSGKIPEAIAVLTVITDELEYIYDCSMFGKQSINLVRKSLVEAERELIGIM